MNRVEQAAAAVEVPLPKTVNERGNTVLREFAPGDRYLYDFKLCTPGKGWMQYDTDQDAWYFGVWVNKGKREILTYAEGDLSLVTCPSVESFNAEIAHMNAFYGEGRECAVVDVEAKTFTECHQDRDRFVIAQETEHEVAHASPS